MSGAGASIAVASSHLRGCGLRGNTYVRATRNVSCSTAKRVIRHSCAYLSCGPLHVWGATRQPLRIPDHVPSRQSQDRRDRRPHPPPLRPTTPFLAGREGCSRSVRWVERPAAFRCPRELLHLDVRALNVASCPPLMRCSVIVPDACAPGEVSTSVTWQTSVAPSTFSTPLGQLTDLA